MHELRLCKKLLRHIIRCEHHIGGAVTVKAEAAFAPFIYADHCHGGALCWINGHGAHIHAVILQRLAQKCTKAVISHFANKSGGSVQPRGCHSQVCRRTAGIGGKLGDTRRAYASLGEVDENFADCNEIHSAPPTLCRVSF